MMTKNEPLTPPPPPPHGSSGSGKKPELATPKKKAWAKPTIRNSDGVLLFVESGALPSIQGEVGAYQPLTS